LRKLFVKLKDLSDDKSRTITELETLVASTKAEREGVREKRGKGQELPPIAPRRELARTTWWGVAQSGAELAKYHTVVTGQARLYSEDLGVNFNQKRYKLTVTTEGSKYPKSTLLKSGRVSTSSNNSETGRCKPNQAASRI
jgi:hypothetical protein